MSIKVICENKKARHDYHILDVFEAGIALMGSELKPIRAGQVQLKDAYVEFMNGEMYLINVHISGYQASSYNNHTPERKRKLLMHKEEIHKLFKRVKEKGLTIIPLKLYFKKGFVKAEIAFVKGKKEFDKRASAKKRDQSKEIAQVMKKNR